MQRRDRDRAYGQVEAEGEKWRWERWTVVDQERTFRQRGRDVLLREKFLPDSQKREIQIAKCAGLQILQQGRRTERKNADQVLRGLWEELPDSHAKNRSELLFST